MELRKFLVRRNRLVAEIHSLRTQRANLEKGTVSKPSRKMLSYRIAKIQRALLRLDLHYGPLELSMRARKIARRSIETVRKPKKPRRPV